MELLEDVAKEVVTFEHLAALPSRDSEVSGRPRWAFCLGMGYRGEDRTEDQERHDQQQLSCQRRALPGIGCMDAAGHGDHWLVACGGT